MPTDFRIHELKRISSIAERFPRPSGGKRGVDPGTLVKHIEAGRLDLGPVILVDGVKHYAIPDDDLNKPDWGLGARYHAKKRGRPTNRERAGLD